MIVPVRRRRARRLRGRRVVLLFAFGAVFCGGAYYLARTRSTPTPVAKPSAPAAQTRAYAVRGQIAQLPDPANPRSALEIRHEPINDFQRKDGTLGMSSMTMSFPVAPGVKLDGLTVEDKIDFTFEVNWGGSPIFQITRIAKLPADTELTFGAAAQPGK